MFIMIKKHVITFINNIKSGYENDVRKKEEINITEIIKSHYSLNYSTNLMNETLNYNLYTRAV